MATVFQLLMSDGATRYGKDVVTDSASIYPGLLVHMNSSGSTAGLAGENDCDGIAFGNRYRPYTPTSATFASGEPFVIVSGHGLCALSADFFTSQALPSVGSTLYSDANGLWHTSGSVKVGKVLDKDNAIVPTGGLGTTEGVAIVEFNVVP